MSEQPFVMSPDVGRREKPGVRASVRMRYNKAAYCWADPETLASLGRPPPHAEVAFRDVFGDRIRDAEGRERLKLAVHPHFRRWCLWERALIPALGDVLWKCIWIAMEDPVPGRLPSDLDGDPLKAHFRGVLGEYREPNRRDFELIESFDKKKYGVNVVTDRLGMGEGAEQAAATKAADEQIDRFLDENWFLAWDEANQIAGSGQYMRDSHCRNWTYKGNIERYRRIQKNGYVVIEKKSRAEFEGELARETVKLLNPADRLIVEELLRERLATMSGEEVEGAAEKAPLLTAAQGAELARRARINRDRVLQSLHLMPVKGGKTL